MGGRVVMYEALTNPESVSSLVVVDVTPNQERSKAMPSSGGISRYLNLLNETTVPSTIPENQIRRYIDEQMAQHVPGSFKMYDSTRYDFDMKLRKVVRIL